MAARFLSNKKILIVSPQPWSFQFISKQHYAMELAKENQVYFLCAPEPGIGWASSVEIRHGVSVVSYQIPLPSIFLFHAPSLYLSVNRIFVERLLAKISGHFDVCFDFGSYQFYSDMSFISADTRVFFPVDDFVDLKPSARGCEHIFSVSKNIVGKFAEAGLACHFINHGLSDDFASVASQKMRSREPWKRPERIRVAYSGSLFSRYLNFDLLGQIIRVNPGIEFHLFGRADFNARDAKQAAWNRFIRSAPNVSWRGFLEPRELAAALASMDAHLLCYQPDFTNYHGENSHKILEYLSTGRVLIATHISLYAGSPLINMVDRGNEGDLPALFERTIRDLELYNNDDLAEQRIRLALDNTYARQLERVEAILKAG